MRITKKHLSRRTVLKGMGVTVALPIPRCHGARPVRRMRRRKRRRPRRSVRLVAMEMVHGAAGSTAFGSQEEPVGSRESRGRLRSVGDQPQLARAVPQRPHDHQQHRCAERRGVHAAGDWRRSFPLERRVPHAGASKADRRQRRALGHVAWTSSTRRSSARTRRFRRCSCPLRTSIRRAAAPTGTPASTPTRSAGRRRHSRCRWCATRAWSSISCSASAQRPRSAPRNRRTDKSILDWVTTQITALRKEIGASDRVRLNEYLDNIREIERRIQLIETRNASGETARSSRKRRSACPTPSKSTSTS